MPEILFLYIDKFSYLQYAIPYGAYGVYMNFNQIESIFGVLDFNSGTPIYRQIEEHIAGFIKNAASNTNCRKENPPSTSRSVNAAVNLNIHPR